MSAPVCPVHNAPMNASQRGGTFYCPKKTGTGPKDYCTKMATADGQVYEKGQTPPPPLASPASAPPPQVVTRDGGSGNDPLAAACVEAAATFYGGGLPPTAQEEVIEYARRFYRAMKEVAT